MTQVRKYALYLPSCCVQSFHFRYAAPEQYIMSTQTPSAPSAPVATALSPVLWQVKLFLRTIHD